MLLMQNILKTPTANICDKQLSCDCYTGGHGVSVKDIFLGENAISMLVPTVQKLFLMGRLIFLACEDVYMLHGKGAVSALKNAGYNVSVHILPPGAEPKAGVCLNFTKEPEDVRAIVSLGSGSITDIAKYYSHISFIPHIAVITAPSGIGCANSRSALYKDDVLTFFPSKTPDTLICDLNIMRKAPRHLIAAGYGSIMSCYALLADLKYSKLIHGMPVCPHLFSLIEQCIEIGVMAGDGLSRDDSRSIDLLSDAVIRMSVAIDMLSGMYTGKACAFTGNYAAFALDAACKSGGKPQRAQTGAAALIMTDYILKIYNHFIGGAFVDLLLPADNGLHAQAICDISSYSLPDALKLVDFKQDLRQLKLIEYKHKEYGGELKQYFSALLSQSQSAQKVFKRIYHDAGFWINGFYSQKELSQAIALAPALAADCTPSLLGYMRNNGYFEHYLISS